MAVDQVSDGVVLSCRCCCGGIEEAADAERWAVRVVCVRVCAREGKMRSSLMK